MIPSTGTPTYRWQWLFSINGGAFANLTLCVANNGTGVDGGTAETCSIAVSTLTVGDTYAFELQVTDSALSPESQTSPAGLVVTVRSALVGPTVPTVSATSLDVDQALTATGTIPSTGTPTYSWQWLISINGGAFTTATQCAVNSGTGASEGVTEACSIAANTLTAGDTYGFELQVTDSATAPETQTSTATSAVTVTTPSSSSSSSWPYLGIALAVIVIVLLATLLVLRRRRPPAAAKTPQEHSQEEPTSPTEIGPPLGAPAYIETPEDTGQAPPVITPAPATVATIPTPPPAAGTTAPTPAPIVTDPESDIAALMAELDKIGSEVVKKAPKTGTSGPDGEPAKEEGKST
jgi:hypothetical protein